MVNDDALAGRPAESGQRPENAAFPLPAVMRVEKAARPMRLAVVTSRLPLPMKRADQMTVAHWLAFLAARGHEVELFALTGASPPDPASLSWLQRHCAAVHLFRRPRWRALLGAAWGWLLGKPLQVGYFADPAQRRALRRQADRFDAVYVYYIRSAESIGRGLGVPTVLGMQLCQTLNVRRMLASFRPGLERLVYMLEAPALRRYEARVWQRFSRTVLIGRADVAAVLEACRAERQPPIDNALLIPHGADMSRCAFAAGEGDDGRTVMFLGVMSTNTNVDAVHWFVERVWPLVRRARPDARFRIVGRRPRRSIRSLHGRDGVEVIGEVPDALPWLARASVCVSPVRAAAGMQNKLLDYFRAARPVVATAAANEGIGAPPGRAIRLADTAEAFAREVIGLLNAPAERQAMGQAARRFVEDGWSWEALFLKLEEAIETAARYPKPALQPGWSAPPQPVLQPEYAVSEPETPWGSR